MKKILCFIMIFMVMIFTFYMDYQEASAIAGVDDIIIMTLAGMLLTAAGIVVTDPNNQESITGETGRMFSSVKSVDDFLNEHFFDQKLAVQNWLIVQAAKYVDAQQHDVISVWNNSTNAYTDVEVIPISVDNELLDNLYCNDWFTNFIDSDVVSGEYSSNYSEVPIVEYQEWSGYSSSPVLTTQYPYQMIINAGPYKRLIVCATKMWNNGQYYYPSDNGTLTVYDQSGNQWNLFYSSSQYASGGYNPLQANYDIYTGSDLSTVFFAKTTTNLTLNSTLSKTKTLDEAKALAIPSTMYIPTNPDVINDIAEGVYDPIDIMTNSGALTADLPLDTALTGPVPDSLTTADKTWWESLFDTAMTPIVGALGIINGVLGGIAGVQTETKTAVQSIADAQAALQSTAGEINWEPLKIAGDLFTNRFPFSLPWDLLRSFTSLVAVNGQPDFTIVVPDTNILKGFAFTVDLSMFEGLLQVAKALELVAFDIGLILITRKLLGGAV